VLTFYRIPNESELLPHALKVPIAVAHNLFDPAFASSLAADGQELKEAEEAGASSESSEETSGAVSFLH
jgi:hypothetical protein